MCAFIISNEKTKDMKTTKLILALGLMTTIGLSSCNKYDDGPAFSLQSKKARVANTWVIAQAYNDGEDVTDSYDEYTLITSKDGNAELKAVYSFGNFTFNYETDGTWKFEDSEKTLVLDFEDNDADRSYQILRLKDDEMWLREEGGEDELHLVSK